MQSDHVIFAIPADSKSCLIAHTFQRHDFTDRQASANAAQTGSFSADVIGTTQ
jgi:hypothetical protein